MQRGDGEGDEAGGIEAGAFGQQTGERAEEQRGADDEDEREGHLQGDDALAEADAAEAGAAALAERVDEVVAAGVEGGSEAAQEAGGEAGQEREGEQAQAEGGAERVGGERRAGRKAIRARMASGARAMPRAPPARARSRLSARSWRPMRPREAPRARRVPISRPRAEPRARKRPATFRQARPSRTPVAANSSQSGWERLRRSGEWPWGAEVSSRVEAR